jgi:phosphoribosylamine--glycine ligase
MTLDWSDDSAVTVVLASEGYPASPKVGEPIMGLDGVTTAQVFHAGTTSKDGVIHSSGGRVLAVTGMGADLTIARDAAYSAISQITMHGSHYRRDIALNAAVAEKGN